MPASPSGHPTIGRRRADRGNNPPESPRRRRRSAPWILAGLLIASIACGDSGPSLAFGTAAATDGAAGAATTQGRSVFVLPRGDGGAAFFDLPWPSDLRRSESGKIDVIEFPNPMRIPAITRYLDAISNHIDGYSTVGASYLRLSSPADVRTLPLTAEDTVSNLATAFLIDVDATSPERGRRHPAVVHYREAATRYWPANTIAVGPLHGMPLAPSRTYAAVLTTGLQAANGGGYAPDDDLAALLFGAADSDEDAAMTAARAVYGPVFDVLDEIGVGRDRILSLAVFTTQDPVTDLEVVRDFMMDSYPEPEARADAWNLVRFEDHDRLIEGRYGPCPIFQRGDIPYLESGGEFTVDASGQPEVHGEYDARFGITVPLGPMPEDGYPVVLYAHGTGGDYMTFARIGRQLAEVGIATIGIDQIHHGPRNPSGTPPEFAFFNYLNPYAARENARQAALDIVQQARFAATVMIPRTLGRSPDDRTVHFNRNRMLFFGHSQGGLNGPLFLAVDDHVKGGVLSGASGTLLISLIDKTEPFPILNIVQVILGLSGSSGEDAAETEHLVYEHPVLTLLQTWIDAADGVNYARRFAIDPRPGFAPKSILQTEGLVDAHSPPGTMESLAAAAGLPVVEPLARQPDANRLLGLAPVRAPIHGNMAGGRATGGLLQFPGADHYVIFNDPHAQYQYRSFLRSVADRLPGTIPARLPTVPPPVFAE